MKSERSLLRSIAEYCQGIFALILCRVAVVVGWSCNAEEGIFCSIHQYKDTHNSLSLHQVKYEEQTVDVDALSIGSANQSG